MPQGKGPIFAIQGSVALSALRMALAPSAPSRAQTAILAQMWSDGSHSRPTPKPSKTAPATPVAQRKPGLSK